MVNFGERCAMVRMRYATTLQNHVDCISSLASVAKIVYIYL